MLAVRVKLSEYFYGNYTLTVFTNFHAFFILAEKNSSNEIIKYLNLNDDSF